MSCTGNCRGKKVKMERKGETIWESLTPTGDWDRIQFHSNSAAKQNSSNHFKDLAGSTFTPYPDEGCPPDENCDCVGGYEEVVIDPYYPPWFVDPGGQYRSTEAFKRTVKYHPEGASGVCDEKGIQVALSDYGGDFSAMALAFTAKLDDITVRLSAIESSLG